MTDWNDIITEALKELRADAIFTRGAILHSKVSQIARKAGLDLDLYLQETKQRFSSSQEARSYTAKSVKSLEKPVWTSISICRKPSNGSHLR